MFGWFFFLFFFGGGFCFFFLWGVCFVWGFVCLFCFSSQGLLVILKTFNVNAFDLSRCVYCIFLFCWQQTPGVSRDFKARIVNLYIVLESRHFSVDGQRYTSPVRKDSIKIILHLLPELDYSKLCSSNRFLYSISYAELAKSINCFRFSSLPTAPFFPIKTGLA